MDFQVKEMDYYLEELELSEIKVVCCRTPELFNTFSNGEQFVVHYRILEYYRVHFRVLKYITGLICTFPFFCT